MPAIPPTDWIARCRAYLASPEYAARRAAQDRAESARRAWMAAFVKDPMKTMEAMRATKAMKGPKPATAVKMTKTKATESPNAVKKKKQKPTKTGGTVWGLCRETLRGEDRRFWYGDE